MTPDQIEFVAQAFYAAEHFGDWDDAPDDLQRHYRDLARRAIAFLRQHSSRHGSSLASKTPDAQGEQTLQSQS